MPLEVSKATQLKLPVKQAVKLFLARLGLELAA